MTTPTRRRRAAATKPETGRITLTLPLPPNLANGRMHWRAKERERVSYNQWCDFWRATSRMVPKGEEWRPPSKPLSPVMISAVITLWNPMDDDNAIARLKWSLDWLVANKYIAGDSRKHVRWSALPEQRIDRSPAHVPTVTFTLTPVTSPSASPSSPPPIPEARGGVVRSTTGARE